jgi:hypothetical protein
VVGFEEPLEAAVAHRERSPAKGIGQGRGPVSVPGDTWYLRPGPVRGCACPSAPARSGRMRHCPGELPAVRFMCAEARSFREQTPGASVTDRDTDDPTARRGSLEPGGSCIPVTSRVTGSSANRPGTRPAGMIAILAIGGSLIAERSLRRTDRLLVAARGRSRCRRSSGPGVRWRLRSSLTDSDVRSLRCSSPPSPGLA